MMDELEFRQPTNLIAVRFLRVGRLPTQFCEFREFASFIRKIRKRDETWPQNLRCTRRTARIDDCRAVYAVNTEQTATQTMIGLGIVGVVCGTGAGFFIVRLMVDPIRDAAEIMKRISQGDFSSSIDITSSDEFGQPNVNMSEMQQKLKDQIESDKIALVSTGRIKAALDKVASSVMLANADLEITYINESAKLLMRRAADDIRKDVPSFDADKLIGSNIDIFHNNRLKDLDSTFSTELEVGGRTFKVIANPVVSESGERLGTVVEWADRSQELGARS